MDRARRRRWLRLAALLVALTITACNGYVLWRGQRDFATPESLTPATVMILGAAVYRDGTISTILKDRLDTAIDLYRSGKATKLLVSGDHRKQNYNEVGAMRAYLLEQGVPATAIVVDHAGFDTYSSMYRARHVFGAARLTVVTQRFHLARALFLAAANGLDAKGVVADRHRYHMLGLREVLSRCKALLDVLRGREPKFPGPPEPGLL